MSAIDYKSELLEVVPMDYILRWLKENPKPDYWEGDRWSWAFYEIPVGLIRKLTEFFRSLNFNTKN